MMQIKNNVKPVTHPETADDDCTESELVYLYPHCLQCW